MTTLEQLPERPAVAPVDFDVTGMTCGSCAARVQRVLSRQDGVASAEVNFATNRATVAFDRAVATTESLEAAVEGIGYHLSRVSETIGHEAAGGAPRAEDADEAEAAREADWTRRVLVAASLAV